MKKLINLISSFLSTYSMAEIDPVVAYTMVEEGRAILIDSREREELEKGMIEGAIWIPLSLTNNGSLIEKLKQIREEQFKIFIYGDSKNSSGKFSAFLQDHQIAAADIGQFETLEEILPVKLIDETSGLSENQML